MKDQKQASMQMALEALIGMDVLFSHLYQDSTQYNAVATAREAITDLREALAQPQGSWVDLTDDEIKTAYESWWETNGNHAFPIWVGAKSVIAAFKEKNK